MILFQDQSASSGCASPISSSYKSFSINGPAASLDTLYVNRTFSLPNIATGSMLIGIQESQEQPYQLMLHLVTPHLQGQKNNYAFDSTWVHVSRNNQNLIMEFMLLTFMEVNIDYRSVIHWVVQEPMIFRWILIKMFMYLMSLHPTMMGRMILSRFSTYQTSPNW